MLLVIRQRFGRVLRLCGAVAGGITFAVMLLVAANVFTRYFFNAPIAGTLEVTESALGYIIFLSLAMTQYEGGHIQVVLITQRLSPRAARTVEVIALSIAVAFFAWATSATLDSALESWSMNEQEWGAIQFPLYPVRFAITLGLALMTLQCLLDAWLAATGQSAGKAHP